MVGLYARQSLDKKDSISIETQLEYGKNICKLENLEYKEYFDKGYSGSNINRPKFQELLKDVENGLIDKIICYRLDRISRSLVDFSNLLVIFEKHNVSFISATEQFDTSTPIGRAMINIIMVFAQLERETIQKRITDNYYARAKRGLFCGGSTPFGFSSEKTIINDKKASILVPNSDIEKIKKIFDLYLNNYSIGYIYRETGIIQKTIRRILSNPIYVKSNFLIYNYYKKLGYKIYNDISEFNGNGLMIFGKEIGKNTRRYTSLDEQIVVVSTSEGIIDPNEFLIIQEKLSKNPVHAKKDGRYSWLTGIIKCGKCDHSIGVTISKRNKKDYSYLRCSNYRLYKNCLNSNCYTTEEVEKEVYNKIVSYISKLDFSKISKVKKTNKQLDALHIELIKLNEQTDNIVNAIANGTKLTNILENKIEEIENKKIDIENKIVEISKDNNVDYINLNDKVNAIKYKFETLDVYQKNSLIKTFVKSISLDNDKLEITYNF